MRSNGCFVGNRWNSFNYNKTTKYGQQNSDILYSINVCFEYNNSIMTNSNTYIYFIKILEFKMIIKKKKKCILLWSWFSLKVFLVFILNNEWEKERVSERERFRFRFNYLYFFMSEIFWIFIIRKKIKNEVRLIVL